MKLGKSKLELKLIQLAFPILLSGCIHNPYTIKMTDLNKDNLPDITITDSLGKATEYIQVNEEEYISSPFRNEHEIKVKGRIMKPFLYTPYKIKIMDLNKDNLSDFVIIQTDMIERYLQRKDEKYILSIEKMRSSHSSDNDDSSLILIWMGTPGISPMYPN